MEGLLIIIGSLIGVGFWVWVLYEIISSASRGNKIFDELELQTLLLVEIAKKLGVEEATIDEIVYEPEEAETEPEPFKPV